MADEMYAVSGETLTDIVNAIRSKTGSDDFMTVAAMASAIEGISDDFPSDLNIVPEVPNTYIEQNGIEVKYGGWTSTGFIPVDGKIISHIAVLGTLNYFCYAYDAEKNPTQSISSKGVIELNENVSYVRFSDTSNNFAYSVYAIKKR